MPISHRLGTILYALENFLPISYHWATILDPQAHPNPRDILLKIEPLHPWVHGKPPMENEVDW